MTGCIGRLGKTFVALIGWDVLIQTAVDHKNTKEDTMLCCSGQWGLLAIALLETFLVIIIL